MSKEKIKMPEQIPCVNHSSKAKPVKGCVKCKQINKRRKDAYLQELTFKAGETIYKHWPEYLKKEQTKGVSLATAVEAAKKAIHELCPWENSSATGQKIWNQTLNELARGMHDYFVPVRKRDKIDLW